MLLIKNSKNKGKGFPYSIPSIGPRADPGVQAVSLQVTVSYPPGGRLPLLSARPAVTSPATEHHRPLAGTKLYCLVTEAHRCKQLAQGCYAALPRAGFEPATYWSQAQMPYPLKNSNGRDAAHGVGVKWTTYKVDGLCVWLLLITTPRLTPQPLLRQRLDADLVDHVVRQVLTQPHTPSQSTHQSTTSYLSQQGPQTKLKLQNTRKTLDTRTFPIIHQHSVTWMPAFFNK